MTTPPPPEQHPAVPPGHQPPPAAPKRTAGFAVGAVAGLVVGAGALGLAWALSGGGGGDEIAATCDMIEATPPLTKDFELGEARRIGGLSELAASFAENDKALQPLADAMANATKAFQMFALDEVAANLDKAKGACDDL